MKNNINLLVELLTNNNKTISTMESCTGGGVANAITNIEGASEVLKFSAVTYSNEYKIKMGVNPDIIEKYSVYSIETANEMSEKISMFTNSDYGIGITGKLNIADKNNQIGLDNIVYISIYDSLNTKFYNESIKVSMKNRKENKELIIKYIANMMIDILREL